MEKLANDELSNVNQRMRSNNLTLHPQKTLALYISPYSRKSSPNLTLTLDADQISISVLMQLNILDYLWMTNCLLKIILPC